MHIYRIEHEDKSGVYQRNWLDKSIGLTNAYNMNSSRHPAPESDSLLLDKLQTANLLNYKWSGLYVFGFASPSQLLNWFYDYDDLQKIGELGTRIAVYDTDDVLTGNTQCMFSQQHHTENEPVKVYTIEEFLTEFGQLNNNNTNNNETNKHQSGTTESTESSNS